MLPPRWTPAGPPGLMWLWLLLWSWSWLGGGGRRVMACWPLTVYLPRVVLAALGDVAALLLLLLLLLLVLLLSSLHAVLMMMMLMMSRGDDAIEELGQKLIPVSDVVAQRYLNLTLM